MPLEIKTRGDVAAQDITADDDFHNIPIKMEQRLDIACGQRLQSGWVGMDIVDLKNTPEESKYIKHDVLSFPWPIADKSIYEARCSHFVEHVPHQLEGISKYKDGLVAFMEEVHRVLMPQGIIVIDAPYYSSQRAHQDPTHCRSITENTFRYFDPQWMAEIGMDHYGIQTDFEILTIKLILDPEYESKSKTAQQYAVKYVINSVQDIQIVLRKRGK
jgi:predicted SAM-dependent methyltransferase